MDRACQSISNPLFFPPHLLAGYTKSLGFAAAITVGLIFLMSQLVATDIEEPKLSLLPAIKPVHMPKKEIVTQTYEEPTPPQAVLEQPTMRVEETEVTPVTMKVVIGTPTPDTSTGVQISRDPLPVYKAKPRYPNAALRRGIEGYAVVEFTVTKTGAVRDARVVGGYDSNGNPTRVFDRSAVAAAERFKYRPQMENGQPVERYGVRNRISYKIAE
ncbi:energy transducer TonB [Microbulbifer sp. ANSA003]|uniref:energy transducer TonB n=1 Tax=Microbulbifer sp. ANSA003 TaxID=3243360 RepID=UPI004042E5F4